MIGRVFLTTASRLHDLRRLTSLGKTRAAAEIKGSLNGPGCSAYSAYRSSLGCRSRGRPRGEVINAVPRQRWGAAVPHPAGRFKLASRAVQMMLAQQPSRRVPQSSRIKTQSGAFAPLFSATTTKWTRISRHHLRFFSLATCDFLVIDLLSETLAVMEAGRQAVAVPNAAPPPARPAPKKPLFKRLIRAANKAQAPGCPTAETRGNDDDDDDDYEGALNLFKRSKQFFPAIAEDLRAAPPPPDQHDRKRRRVSRDDSDTDLYDVSDRERDRVRKEKAK